MKAIRAVVAALALWAAWPAGPDAAAAESPLDNVLGLLGKGFAAKGLASGLPAIINADTLSYDEETGVAIAEGNVEINFGERTIRADKIYFNARTREAELVAHVRFVEKGDEFSFDRVVIDMDTERGVLEKGTIRLSTNNYQIASERFEKTGPRTFVLRKGSLTTCPCDPVPDWRFDVGQTRATIDGYAVGRNIVFRVRGVPVLWLPYAAFPVKLSRQSGFLLPVYTRSSSRGYSLQIPYYWAVNRWSDATLTLDAMSRRGLRPEAEYRFVLNSQSTAEIHGTVHRDKATSDTRWRLFGTNVFRFGEEYTANADWDFPSDNAYYVDMLDAERLRSARHVPSAAFVAKTGESQSHAVGVVWIKDLQGTPGDNTLQRLPEYTATVLPVRLGAGGIEGQGEAQVAYLHRRDGESALRGRGYLELSRTLFAADSVTATPYVGVDLLGATRASFAADNQAGRVVPTAGAFVGAEAKREYAGKADARYVHAVAPGIGYRWVPRVDQSEIQTADQWSRLHPQNQLLFSLVQRVIRVGPAGGPRELASLELSWALELGRRFPSESPYIDPLSPYERALRDQIDLVDGAPKAKNAASDVYGRLRLSPGNRLTLNGEALFDPNDGRVTMSAVGGEWNAGAEKKALLEYRSTRGLAEDIYGMFAVRPLKRVGLSAQASYSIRDARLTDGSGLVTLYPRSDCWSVGIGMTRKTKPDESSVKVTFSLKGIGTVGH